MRQFQMTQTPLTPPSSPGEEREKVRGKFEFRQLELIWNFVLEIWSFTNYILSRVRSSAFRISFSMSAMTIVRIGR